MTDDVRMVPVRDLLLNLRDSCDSFDLSSHEGWQDMLRSEIEDGQFPALVRSLQERGQLDPICAEEWYTSDGEPCWNMGNGHHRLAAAILLGWDHILVDFSGEYTDRSDAHERQFCEEMDATFRRGESFEWATLWRAAA